MFWHRMTVNQSTRWPLMSIFRVLTSIIPWIVTLAFPARLGMATDSPPAIFSNATTTLWGWPGSIINLLSYVLRAFWQKLRTVQEWGASKKGYFVGRVISRSAPQKLENVTAQPRWTTLPITPQNILQEWCSGHALKSQYHCTQGIPSEMCPRVEAQRRDTNTHCTALIVNKAKTHFAKHQRGHIFTPQPELELQAIFSTP